MRVVFLGTPEVARIALDALLASRHQVVAVVTQPDKPRGRSGAPQPPPVKVLAEDRGVPVLQPRSPKEDGFADALAAVEPEALAVVAYGHILPVPVLQVAPAYNAHYSLLPAYRGAAPVQRAILDGAAETGVTVFRLEPSVDTGPMLARERVAVGDDETAGELLGRLAPIGARLLVEVLDAVEDGRAQEIEQDDTQASRAPKVTTEEARIDWARPADAIVRGVRAFNPAPGAWTTLRGKRLLVWRAGVTDGAGAPGAVLDAGKERVVVAAGEGAVELREVQPEGKTRMSGAELARGYRPAPGESLGA